MPVDEWCSNAGFQQGKSLISSVSVVNDAVERGVKLAYDFLGTDKKLLKVLKKIYKISKNIKITRF